MNANKGEGTISGKSNRKGHRWLRKLRPRKLLRNILILNGKLLTAAGIAMLAIAVVISGAAYRTLMSSDNDPAVYAPLLNTIAKGESQGNYNAYFGNAKNTSIRFTSMSITEILRWQQDYVAQGHASSAIGKYQIIRPTLAGLVDTLHLSPKTKFDEKTQDRLAVALLQKRGVDDYMHSRLSREQFAANLAREWAALPKISGSDGSQSYYAGDGINKVQVSIGDIYKALATIKPKPAKS